MNKYLPIGSIIRLNKEKRLIMITGYLKNNLQVPNKIYDYCGCEFPVGLDPNAIILFDEKDIDALLFVGYQTSQSINYRKQLYEEKNKIKGETI